MILLAKYLSMKTVSLIQTKLFVDDKGGSFNKVIVDYRLNTLYYSQDDLALQIDALYRILFIQYGKNARIFTNFYFDNNDVAGPNWICMGLWNELTAYEIKWSYISNVEWLVGDMAIFSKRKDIQDQEIKSMLSEIYLSTCEKSKRAYEMLVQTKGWNGLYIDHV